MRFPFKILAPLALVLAASGCSGIPISDTESGATHHVILGFGIVSVSDPKSAPEVTAVRVHALGLSVDTGPTAGVALGYKSATAIQAAPDADTCVEINSGAFGPMFIKTSSHYEE